jgi:hypothetical protein
MILRSSVYSLVPQNIGSFYVTLRQWLSCQNTDCGEQKEKIALESRTWAGSAHRRGGRFGRARSVPCVGGHCRRRIHSVSSFAPSVAENGSVIASICPSCTATDGIANFSKKTLKTSLPRKVIVASPEKLREMAERGGCNLNLDTRQALDHGIEIGRGGVWLELSEEQYQRLRSQGEPTKGANRAR